MKADHEEPTAQASAAGKGERRLGVPFLVAAVCWTILIGVLAGWSYRQSSATVFDIARAGARNSYEKDVVSRLWATGHGGVYVPITPETPPNPYLAHLPDRDIETPAGKKLTLMNPAYMTRQIHELSQARHGLREHITSLRPIRPENAPDAWEKQALQAFEQGEKEVSSLEPIGDLSSPHAALTHGGRMFEVP